MPVIQVLTSPTRIVRRTAGQLSTGQRSSSRAAAHPGLEARRRVDEPHQPVAGRARAARPRGARGRASPGARRAAARSGPPPPRRRRSPPRSGWPPDARRRAASAPRGPRPPRSRPRLPQRLGLGRLAPRPPRHHPRRHASSRSRLRARSPSPRRSARSRTSSPMSMSPATSAPTPTRTRLPSCGAGGGTPSTIPAVLPDRHHLLDQAVVADDRGRSHGDPVLMGDDRRAGRSGSAAPARCRRRCARRRWRAGRPGSAACAPARLSRPCFQTPKRCTASAWNPGRENCP